MPWHRGPSHGVSRLWLHERVVHWEYHLLRGAEHLGLGCLWPEERLGRLLLDYDLLLAPGVPRFVQQAIAYQHVLGRKDTRTHWHPLCRLPHYHGTVGRRREQPIRLVVKEEVACVGGLVDALAAHVMSGRRYLIAATLARSRLSSIGHD